MNERIITAVKGYVEAILGSNGASSETTVGTRPRRIDAYGNIVLPGSQGIIGAHYRGKERQLDQFIDSLASRARAGR